MTTSHHVTPRTYMKTLLALMLLAGTSFVASYLPLGAWEMPAALLIAAVKGTLVALFFMHLIEQDTIHHIVILVAVAFLAILIVLMALDVTLRVPPPLRPRALSRLGG